MLGLVIGSWLARPRCDPCRCAQANQALVNWPGGVYAEYNTAGDQIMGSITIQIIGFAVALGGLAFGMLVTRLVSDHDYAFDVTKPPRGKITGRVRFERFGVDERGGLAGLLLLW